MAAELYDPYQDLSFQRPRKRKRTDSTAVPAPSEETDPILPDELAATILNHSLVLLLRSHNIDGASSTALEQLREIAENYFMSLLQDLQLLALAQRRSVIAPVDFEDLFKARGLPLSDLSDEFHRVPSQPRIPLAQEPAATEPEADYSRFLGPLLEGREKPLHESLPPLPSLHTYRATPLYTERPTRPKDIREQATKDSKEVGQALRRLLAVAAQEGKKNEVEGKEGGLWMKTWREMEGGEGAVKGRVNADSQFWRRGGKRV